MTSTTKMIKGLGGSISSIAVIATFFTDMWKNALGGDIPSLLYVIGFAFAMTAAAVAFVRDWSDGPGLTSREIRAIFVNLILVASVIFGVYIVAYQVPAYRTEPITADFVESINFNNGSGYETVSFSVSDGNVTTSGATGLSGTLQWFTFVVNRTYYSLGDLKEKGIVGIKMKFTDPIAFIDFKRNEYPYNVFMHLANYDTSYEFKFTVSQLEVWYMSYGNVPLQFYIKMNDTTSHPISTGISLRVELLYANDFKYWDIGLSLAFFVSMLWIGLRFLEFDDDIIRMLRRRKAKKSRRKYGKKHYVPTIGKIQFETKTYTRKRRWYRRRR